MFLPTECSAREIVGQDGVIGEALFRKCFGTPLAEADSVAVAVGHYVELTAFITDGKIGASQAQRSAEECPGPFHTADRQPRDIAGGRAGGGAEPLFRRGRIRGEPLGCQCGLYLRGGEGQGDLIMIRLEICAAVHGDQIGEGGTPDILAGLGAAVGDGKVARPSRGTLIAEHLGQDAVYKGGETDVVGIVTGAPVAVEDGVCQVALPPCGVGGEPGSVGGCGVVAAVENMWAATACALRASSGQLRGISAATAPMR